jgi:hypothetical protein
LTEQDHRLQASGPSKPAEPYGRLHRPPSQYDDAADEGSQPTQRSNGGRIGVGMFRIRDDRRQSSVVIDRNQGAGRVSNDRRYRRLSSFGYRLDQTHENSLAEIDTKHAGDPSNDSTGERNGEPVRVEEHAEEG